MKPEDIKRKAQEQRSKDAERKREALLRSKNVKEIRRPRFDDLSIFFRIFRGHYFTAAILFSVISIVPGMLDAFVFKWPGSAIECSVKFFMAMFLLWNMFYFTILVFKYMTYKSFFSAPPIPIAGWESITNADDYPRVEHWASTSLTVFIKDGASADVIELLKDALYLFRKEANGCYYTADSPSSDARVEWKSAGAQPFKITGYSNSLVAWKLYLFMRSTLVGIQKKYQVIEKIEVHFSEKAYSVSRPSAD